VSARSVLRPAPISPACWGSPTRKTASTAAAAIPNSPAASRPWSVSLPHGLHEENLEQRTGRDNLRPTYRCFLRRQTRALQKGVADRVRLTHLAAVPVIPWCRG